jgi:hypothetical protein
MTVQKLLDIEDIRSRDEQNHIDDIDIDSNNRFIAQECTKKTPIPINRNGGFYYAFKDAYRL